MTTTDTDQVPTVVAATERGRSKKPLPSEKENATRPDTRIKTTVACYSVFDKFFPTCDILDYTEGIYNGDSSTPYDAAQRNQINYVLDEVKCVKGTRILEIGCGNGTLLDEVKRRGAVGVGITISPEQVQLCQNRDLDVRLLDYRDLESNWAKFDAVVANGPVEHFVQPAEAAAGKDDDIYRAFFHIVHSLIDPASHNRRFINTTIHFVRPPDPQHLLRGPDSFSKNSDSFHYAMLARSFGGWYPVDGQLQRCADGYFQLTKTTNGTYDYHLTSEHWLRRIRRALSSPELFRAGCRALPLLVSHPIQLARMLRCMLISESWNWQFRGPNAPTKLLRQTWSYLA
jgi:cyclopropane fatty-acyl-phospholipid synthase-like methyltransferase